MCMPIAKHLKQRNEQVKPATILEMTLNEILRIRVDLAKTYFKLNAINTKSL